MNKEQPLLSDEEIEFFPNNPKRSIAVIVDHLIQLGWKSPEIVKAKDEEIDYLRSILKTELKQSYQYEVQKELRQRIEKILKDNTATETGFYGDENIKVVQEYFDADNATTHILALIQELGYLSPEQVKQRVDAEKFKWVKALMNEGIMTSTPEGLEGIMTGLVQQRVEEAHNEGLQDATTQYNAQVKGIIAEKVEEAVKVRTEAIVKCIEDNSIFEGRGAGTMTMKVMKWWWKAKLKEWGVALSGEEKK